MPFVIFVIVDYVVSLFWYSNLHICKKLSHYFWYFAYIYIYPYTVYIYGTLNNLGNISNKACMLISENSRSMFFFLLFMKSNFVFMPQQETNHHLYLLTLTKDKTCLFERSEAADNDCWGRELSFNNWIWVMQELQHSWQEHLTSCYHLLITLLCCLQTLFGIVTGLNHAAWRLSCCCCCCPCLFVSLHSGSDRKSNQDFMLTVIKFYRD